MHWIVFEESYLFAFLKVKKNVFKDQNVIRVDFPLTRMQGHGRSGGIQVFCARHCLGGWGLGSGNTENCPVPQKFGIRPLWLQVARMFTSWEDYPFSTGHLGIRWG